MQDRLVKKAHYAYREGDYGYALRLYHEIASNIGHNLFYANVALCLDKLNFNGRNTRTTCLDLVREKKFNILNEILDKDVVVSLTSYPARINTVHETIKSIMAQSYKPWKLILWLAEEQFPGQEKDLSPELVRLMDIGLSIKWCEDIRSFKKLIPTLKKYPEKIIVTADDDIIYGKNWLAQLIIEHIQDQEAIICHRAHRITLDDKGDFLPYNNWIKEIKDENSSLDYLFTGCGGVLYPQGSLHKFVQDQILFSSICPNGDDLWFWAMAVLNGTKIQIVKNSSFELDFVPGTQETALWIENVRKDGNDVMIKALNKRYPEILKKIKDSSEQKKSIHPQVSIIIPVFNTGKYLNASLDSIICQRFKNFEVLCIDDGSTDELTKDVLSKYSKQDPRVRVICQRNSGPATARNNGLKNAKGDYIAFVDSDDYISEDYIEELYKCARRHGADIAVAEKILCVNGNNPPVEKKSGFELYGKIDSKQLAAQVIVTTGVSWNKLYKRKFLLRNRIKYLDGMRCQSEDNYFSIMAMIAGHENISLAPNTTYYYRQHEDGITKNITRDSFDKSILVYDEVKKELKRKGITDERYWINVVNQRALKDLRYSVRNLDNDDDVEISIVNRFTSVIDICCIADEKYVIPTMVFLESIKKTKRNTTIPSITILVPKGSKKDMEILEEISSGDFFVKLLEVDSSQFENLHKYNEKDNYCMASPSAMFKFIISKIFSHLDRTLYIDTDLIVRKDLLELFMTDMAEEYLCAVPDLWSPVTDREDIKKFKPYFNSGVMLMNLAVMRNENLSSKLINAKLNSTNYNLMDQDVFNEVCNGHIKKLDIKFNFLPVCYKRHKHRFDINVINRLYDSNYKKIEEIASDPVVVHWAGSDKPWVSNDTLFSDEWVTIFESLKLRGNLNDGLDLEV